MSDGQRSTWATFLSQMTARPGWSVARLARESGIHRSTIFRWLKGDGGLTMASVAAIADALDVPRQTAVLAAGNLIARAEPDEDDEEIAAILAAPVSVVQQKRMLEMLFEMRERDKQRRMADIQFLLDRELERQPNGSH